MTEPPSSPRPSAATSPAHAATLRELDAAVDRISTGGASVGPQWGVAHRAMLKLKTDPSRAARLVASRDLEGLRTLLRELRGESPAAEAMDDVSPLAATAADAPSIDADTLRAAMRAFRKRLKLMRLDHESRLGVGPLTGGKGHEIDGILPPREYPSSVWRALVTSGQLRDLGRGFLALADEVGSAE